MARKTTARSNGRDDDAFWEAPKHAPKASAKKPRRKTKGAASRTRKTIPVIGIQLAAEKDPMVRRLVLWIVNRIKKLSPLKAKANAKAKKRGRPPGSKDKKPRKKRAVKL